MWWALIWNNIESYDYNNYDDNKHFDGYEGYEGFDDFDDIINQEGGIQIYMFEPFAWDCGKNGCRIYWSLTCHKIYYVFLGISSKKYLQGWTCKKFFFVVLYSLLWKEGRKLWLSEKEGIHHDFLCCYLNLITFFAHQSKYCLQIVESKSIGVLYMWLVT